MKCLPDGLVRLDYAFNRRAFIGFEKILVHIATKKKLTILFSKKAEWQEDMVNGFKGLPHKLTFAELTEANIAEYDLVVPLTIEDVFYLDTVRHLVAPQAIPIPSMECVLLCNDKYLFAQRLIETGFGDYIPQIGEEQKYPFFIKKKIDKWSENTHLILDHTQEQALLQQINRDDYYQQECVAGNCEYATHIIFVKKIICAITVKHCYGNTAVPIQGKQKKLSKIVQCKHLDLFAAILNSLGYEGLCCIDYKVKNGRPMIFEINPRFGGSLAPFFFTFTRHFDLK